MSKIAIISQPDQGVLIDVGGCVSLEEVTHHLTSTLQIASEFWKGMNVDLNLGQLPLTQEEVMQVMSIMAEVGIVPHQVFAENEITKDSLAQMQVSLGTGKPMTLAVGPNAIDEPQALKDLIKEQKQQVSELAKSKTMVLVEQAENRNAVLEKKADAVLYLRQTLRSGQSVSHKGHLVIVGDVNPGAEVLAEGDITVWGSLRGVAAAGINGNVQAEIRALRLEPIQLRIAHAIARAPDKQKLRKLAGPETAKIVNGSIRIAANVPD